MRNPQQVNQLERQAFAARLRQALEQAGVSTSPTVVAHEFNLRYWGQGVTVHAVRNWLIGQSLPNQDKLVVLADWLRIDPQTLRFGHTPSPGSSTVLERSLNQKDQDMLVKYLMLPPKERDVVCEVVAAFARQSPSPVETN
jgi:transcriptional regulator with XRE-family HTH domain